MAPLPRRSVEVQVIGADFLDVLLARDISIGGVGVSVPHGFEGSDISAEVQLIIKLPERKAFMARGIVRHTNRALGLFGIEFTDITARVQGELAVYVDKLVALGRTR